jgi:hypothetical protein
MKKAYGYSLCLTVVQYFMNMCNKIIFKVLFNFLFKKTPSSPEHDSESCVPINGNYLLEYARLYLLLN